MVLLKDLLANKESYHLEFKKSSEKLSKDIWETYSAFANTDGGYIIFGVTEPEPYQYEIKGVINPDKIRDDLFNTAANLDKVSRNILNNQNVTTETIDEKTIIIIRIDELAVNQKPLYLNKNLSQTYIRKMPEII